MTARRPDPGAGSEAEIDQPIFRAEQAFVVQFSGNAVAGGCLGRVEHVVSGHSARFTTRDELVGFMDAIRREVARGGDPTGPSTAKSTRRDGR